jgi:hypothetical protein
VVNLYRRGLIDDEQVEAQIKAIDREARDLQLTLEEIKARQATLAAREAQFARVPTMLDDLRAGLAAVEAGGPEAKRPYVERLVSGIVVNTERVEHRPHHAVTINYTFSLDAELSQACSG